MGRPRKVKPAEVGDSSPAPDSAPAVADVKAVEAAKESVPVPVEPVFPDKARVKNNTASRQSFPFLNVQIAPHGSAEVVFGDEKKLERFKSIMQQINSLYGYDAIVITGE